MRPDVAGRPLKEAERLLKAAQIEYEAELTCPTRHVFPLDEACLYVVRQRNRADGGLCLTVAARQRKEVSGHGVQDR